MRSPGLRLSDPRDVRTLSAAVKLAVFTVVSVVVTGTLAAIMGNVGFGDRTTYRALLTSASLVEPGDDVRVAGIAVGEVSEVEIHDRTMAMVTFKVASDVPLTEASRAEVRFQNLVGDRYLALEEGRDAASAAPLAPGATIPPERTSPALDLTELYQGFQPLFTALEPEDVNELSANIVAVLQGEGGTVRELLAETASLTGTLADRDALIGDVITNLDALLGTVDGRRTELAAVVVELRRWLTNLAQDRDVVGRSVESLAGLTDELGDLLVRGRPLLAADVRQLRRLTSILSDQENLAVITQLLDRLPEAMTDQTRIGTYGSWYNYYLCDFEGSIRLPDLGVDLTGLQRALNSISFHSTAPRCR